MAGKDRGTVRATGESSVAAYAAMPRRPPGLLLRRHRELVVFPRGRARETERFPNLKLLETRDEFVYFGGDWDGPFQASPIQTYLELAAAPQMARAVPAEWFKPLKTYMPNILDFDYESLFAGANAVVFGTLTATTWRSAAPGGILPLLKDREHLVIMHDISDAVSRAGNAEYGIRSFGAGRYGGRAFGWATSIGC